MELTIPSTMVVCTLCGGLRGRSATHPDLVQRCHCTDAPSDGIWEGFDFRRDVEMCGLCAAVVIRSGSRWSTLVCDLCLPLARDANKRAGFTLVAVGRHSIVNGLTLTPAPGAGESPAVFLNGLGGVRAALDDQRAWRRRLVHERVSGDPQEVELSTYLQAVESQGFDRQVLLDRFQQHRRQRPAHPYR